MISTQGISKLIKVLAFSLSPVALAAPDVSILEMSSISTEAYGQTSQTVYMKVLIPNKGFEKNVSVIFQKDGGSPQRVVARYLGPAEAGTEVWEVYTNLGPGNQWVQVEYAEAETGGDRTTWLLREGSGPVLYDGRKIMAVYEQPVVNRGTAQFHAVVKNLAYGKRVQAHYSTDGWKTMQTLDLSYSRVFHYGRGSVVLPNEEGFEIWSGVPDLADEIGELSYYLTYEVAGQTFVDNNFGHNYTFEIR